MIVAASGCGGARNTAAAHRGVDTTGMSERTHARSLVPSVRRTGDDPGGTVPARRN